MTGPLQGDGFRIRRAEPGDAGFLAALHAHPEVERYVAAVRTRDSEGLLEEIARSRDDPQHYGTFVIDAGEEGSFRAAGAVEFEVANRRSRIAYLGGLALHPDFRGRGLATRAIKLLQRHLIYDLGYHRLQLEIYGFNEQAIRITERAGFVREGVRRMAYWRHDAWQDGIIFGLVQEDLEKEGEI